MIGSIRLGRFLGFEISIHWSWIFIFFLVTASFAEGILKDSFPRWDGGQRWTAGALIAFIFFFSILLHEVSHSLVARRYGLPVTSITLFVFGGVSNLGKEPASPGQEFWIAIVGPLTSVTMAVLFGAGFVALGPVSEGAAEVSLNLAAINLAIGIFNLVPGFPLDGGRVLRSLLWARRRDLLSATKLASRVGQIVANLIMALGVVVFIADRDYWVTGLWFFLIGNFLRSASAASYETLLLETVLKGVPATVLAKQDYVPISPEMTIAQLVEEHILAGHGRAFPVMAGEELLGLITLTDTRNVPREDWPKVTVYRAMTPASKLRTVTASDELARVLQIMAGNDINQVPLMEGRLLRGLIHRGDVVRYIQTRQEIGAGASTY
ncbi:MAG TPA: site-2 protease family protein [Dehalococcoidia bacterium]|nr:site-2 protease family protein [Dehalococcoidia bacterium]